MKKVIESGIVILCLVPLFFINIKNSHDWGDDFAQYIHQAQNILQGTSQNETGYIFNENAYTAPKAYPTGFPLLLAPVIHVFGSGFRVLDSYMTLFLALTCFMGFLLLRLRTSYITAILTTLIIAYNPLFLHFKTEVLSDLPFCFFSMLCIYIILQKESLFMSIVLGLLLAFTMHIRAAGAPLIGVFVLHKLFIENSWKNFSFKKHLNTGISLLVMLAFYYLIKVLFPCDVNYHSLPDTTAYWQTINDHLSYNVHQLSWVFRVYDQKYFFYIGIVASSSLVVFSILGFLHSANTERFSFLNLYVLAYIFMVMNHRFSHQGLRFFYPILFFIFLYAIIGLRKSLEPFTTKPKWLGLIAAALVFYSYNEEIERINNNEQAIIEGPQLPEAEALFTYINTSLPQNSVIAFDKPRVLALYTKMQSFTFDPSVNKEGILHDIKQLKAGYILTSESLSTENIKSFPTQDTALCKLVFSNPQFKLFKLTPEGKTF